MGEDNLGAFLRARRNAADAALYPFASHTRRRVPGLRREEVAELAGLSTDYYLRLEQGREKNPSGQVLTALSAALQMTRHQDERLHLLAGRSPQRTPSPRAVDPSLAHLLETSTDSAAFILDSLLNITQLNPLAEALFSGFADNGNFARNAFLDPAGRHFFADWNRAAESCVGALRTTMDFHPDRQERDALITELRTDSEFDRLWQLFAVEPKTREGKVLHHERAGTIAVTFYTFQVAEAPGQQLVVYEAEADGSSEQRMKSLLAVRS
ncbi:helix-turn-helix transcriptional regulator [Arthrobacter sp. zg-Y1143]|uniref:helix-turn-helix domain-containing protein n=1 Tax=Arthrobacter sp. zg-Y1143 TaxID=3049065 RepID=UPI0024C27D40|nr:helix-turn-helix transcriptional regulator [Arthrobacter sp. zg-Y1143]MDK1328256.1 helix-turn-helix transcriptional regulator [Arthrobacter sp. zg-Y1143]